MGELRELRRALGGAGGGAGAGGDGEPPPWPGTPEPDEWKLPEWAAELKTDKKGNIENTYGNACVILMRSDEWKGLRFDEFRGEPFLFNAPDVPSFDRPKDGPVDDYSISHMWQWLSLRYGLGIGITTLETAALVASKAKGRAYHPVRSYLRSLVWDGVRRLDSWLTDYAGVISNEYTRSVGRMWLVGAVARTMVPGSICKTMPILEGPQDAGKSTLLRTICPKPEWFSDTPIDIGKQGADKYQALRGKLIVEIPELDGFRGKEARSIKAFISSPVDSFRASYGKRYQDVPRQCVFAGTTNEDRYLQDASGNVRFWPVRVNGAIDVQGLLVETEAGSTVRDQLWAEALDYYNHGATWHIIDPGTIELARAEQEAREEEDPWQAPVEEWLRAPLNAALIAAGFTTHQVLAGAINMAKDRMGRHEETRIGIVLKKIGGYSAIGKPRRYKPIKGTQAAQPVQTTISDDFGPEEYP